MIDLQKYESLLERFVSRKMSADEFERDYLVMFKSETENMSESVYQVLGGTFADVDSYCSDPELRDEEHDLDELQLLAAARLSLKQLRTLRVQE